MLRRLVFPFEQALQNFQQLWRIDRELIKTRQAVAAISAETLLRSRGQSPSMPVEFMSQYGEDLLAWDLFKNQPTGFFIEIGAFDGYHYSSTYALEALGWTGLLVEPLPLHAAACEVRRKRSRVVHAALQSLDTDQQTSFWKVKDQYDGMFSYSVPTPQHLNGISAFPRSEITVPATSLNRSLASHSDPIDLCVIDVEGAELEGC
jgi:FkbM family methyltransferase